MSIQITYSLMTHPGLIRMSNEDVLKAGTILIPDSGGNPTKIHFIVACDGMGGMKAGETASHITCQSVVSYLQSIPFWPGLEEDVCQILQDAVMAAHQSISLLSDTDYDKSGMGSTLALLLLHKNRAYVHWIGDSRIYLLSKRNSAVGIKQDGLDLLTRDHSINWNLAESGVLTLDQIRNAPGSHVLTQSIGSPSLPVSETRVLDVHVGDRFMVCTDGVNLHIDTKEMYQILQGYADQNTAIQKMQDVILYKGAKDNFSIGIVDIVAVQSKEPALIKPAPSKKKSNGIHPAFYLLPLFSLTCFIIWKTTLNKYSIPDSEASVIDTKNSYYLQEKDFTIISIEAAENVKSAYHKLDSINLILKNTNPLISNDTSQLTLQRNSITLSSDQKKTATLSHVQDYTFKKKEYEELYNNIKKHYNQYIKTHPKPGISEQTYMINLELLMGEVENNKKNNDFKNLKNINWQIQYLTKKFTDLQSKLTNLQ